MKILPYFIVRYIFLKAAKVAVYFIHGVSR